MIFFLFLLGEKEKDLSLEYTIFAREPGERKRARGYHVYQASIPTQKTFPKSSRGAKLSHYNTNLLQRVLNCLHVSIYLEIEYAVVSRGRKKEKKNFLKIVASFLSLPYAHIHILWCTSFLGRVWVSYFFKDLLRFF